MPNLTKKDIDIDDGNSNLRVNTKRKLRLGNWI